MIFNNLHNNMYRISNYLCNEVINKIPSHTIRLFLYRKLCHLTIGNHSSIGMHTILNGAYGIKIGDNCAISQHVYLDGRGKLDIGNNVNLARGSSVHTAYHNPKSSEWEYIEKKVTINNDVWIASNATVIQGITIKRGAIVAAGSVVVKDVGAFDIVGGNPAKKIAERNKKIKYLTNYFEFLY